MGGLRCGRLNGAWVVARSNHGAELCSGCEPLICRRVFSASDTTFLQRLALVRESSCIIRGVAIYNSHVSHSYSTGETHTSSTQSQSFNMLEVLGVGILVARSGVPVLASGVWGSSLRSLQTVTPHHDFIYILICALQNL